LFGTALQGGAGARALPRGQRSGLCERDYRDRG